MDQDLLDATPSYNRLALRAVVVPAGQDASAALAAAGILHPVSLPVAIADSPAEAAQILGTGAAPHLRAVLEHGQAAGDFRGAACPAGTGHAPGELPGGEAAPDGAWAGQFQAAPLPAQAAAEDPPARLPPTPSAALAGRFYRPLARAARMGFPLDATRLSRLIRIRAAHQRSAGGDAAALTNATASRGRPTNEAGEISQVTAETRGMR